jgi:GNAT superfamily N-acetyltransferase
MGERHDAFWAEWFGVEATDLRSPGVSIVSHRGLQGYRGAWFFMHGGRLVVSAPDGWVERIRGALAGVAQHRALPTEAWLAELFGESLERLVGPAFQGALDAGNFRPFSSAQVRTLTSADADAVAVFRSACGADGWSDAALDKALLFRMGYFDGSRLVALAGFRPWSASAGDPCVLTLPDYRGRGCAKAVVSRVLATALAREHVPLYQTLEANAAAVGVALSLGYERYANHVAVRLTTDAPTTR